MVKLVTRPAGPEAYTRVPVSGGPLSPVFESHPSTTAAVFDLYQILMAAEQSNATGLMKNEDTRVKIYIRDIRRSDDVVIAGIDHSIVAICPLKQQLQLVVLRIVQMRL